MDDLSGGGYWLLDGAASAQKEADRTGQKDAPGSRSP
jgi:hypothetical protein